MTIKHNSSGGGSITIAPPVTAGNYTLTLPAATDTVATISQTGGFKNKIINGKMEIAQRGTSFPAIASGSYSVDRWFFGNASAAVGTVTQQADAPSSNEFQNSYRFAVTTADTSIAAGDILYLMQAIEGYNVRDLIGRTFTLSFWVRSSKTGIHCVSFRNSGVDRTYVAEYTINSANTWEYKTITVTGGLITAGTWNWTNGAGVFVSWALASGSTYNTTAGAWQTGNFLATANQVNCLDTIGNIFAITGVQLEAGSVATPFEHRPYGAELALCQRYFQVNTFYFQSYAAGAGTATMGTVFNGVTMRAAPTSGLTGLSYGGVASAAVYQSQTVQMGSIVVTASGTGATYVQGNLSLTAEL